MECLQIRELRERSWSDVLLKIGLGQAWGLCHREESINAGRIHNIDFRDSQTKGLILKLRIMFLFIQIICGTEFENSIE